MKCGQCGAWQDEWSEWHGGKAAAGWETCQKAVERGMKIQAENRRLRELLCRVERATISYRWCLPTELMADIVRELEKNYE